jgi:hypothetical protein
MARAFCALYRIGRNGHHIFSPHPTQKITPTFAQQPKHLQG